jgi:pyruvate/2-oxoglutarate dehydrogenase complex dihydrolipoamide acyltransferase (E2) component
MMVDIRVPEDLWLDDRQGVIVSWLYQDGARVEAGKLITELMVEKAQLELFAPASGRLKILCEPEAVVDRGQVIGSIEPIS